ncbi:Hypothetical predicted protein [Lecanosticta acicola]|uniref:AB hydrolase-1 domain-containing protein n=1 Tax=Lecanosticta acicola TaxID=111012 RepID=A0AAI9E3W9_9PEZI|nr:Hypothetical predicted protein [Lecanosticta acicola]
MKKTLLLVFIHGFKGSDHTFHNFPRDLQSQLAKALPKLNVVALQYPQYETRGDLRDAVASFKEWLQNNVIDLEVARGTASPNIDPGVHVILCGHSMGGIVAAETLLSIARDEPVPSSNAADVTNSTAGASSNRPRRSEEEQETTSTTPEPSRFFFPYIQAVLAFDTPYLGISPGVLAHGAEEQGVTAYKAFDTATKFFGWNSPNRGASPAAGNAEAAGRGLPAANSSSSGGASKWGKYAMYGGAAAAIAGVAGAAYLNWNQINQGLTWAGSHLEFVGCLAKGAELQNRVEKIVDLTQTHGIGFANFYGALDEKITSKTKYAGAILGQDRTFCVVPKEARKADSPTGTKRDHPPSEQRSRGAKRQRTQGGAEMEAEMEHGEQVQEFIEDTTKSKGKWVKCVNAKVGDELSAHTSMFSKGKNPDYGDMVPRARDQILEWIDGNWYEDSADEQKQAAQKQESEENATAGSEAAPVDEDMTTATT